jgi:UDP-N-acetyl-2-amino-2-deoxyglucuronate dehydrogenase
MTKKIGIALLGCGRVAQHYAKIFPSIDSSCYEVLGCCDIDAQKAESISNILKSKSFTDYEMMLDTVSPDLVIVLTPSGMHFQHSKIALERDIHVLVEKPITMIPSQAIELEEISKKKGLLYCVAFQNRFNPAIQKIKSAFDSGRFGKIVTATIRLRWCR